MLAKATRAVGILLAAAALAGCGSGQTTTVTVTNGQQGGGASTGDNGGSVTGDGGGSVTEQPSGKLALVDSGFSQYSSYGTHGINYALLIKNQSNDSSFDQADVTVSFLNKSGTSVASDEAYANAIPPGTVGAVVSDVIDVPVGAKVVKMVVEIGDPYSWVNGPSGSITGRVVSVHANNSYGTYEVKTTSLFKSSFAQQLKDVDAIAVYRNASGKIIGGIAEYINVIPANGRANHVFDDFPNFGGIRRVEVYAGPSSITEFG
jgi:hypothetical protein